MIYFLIFLLRFCSTFFIKSLLAAISQRIEASDMNDFSPYHHLLFLTFLQLWAEHDAISIFS